MTQPRATEPLLHVGIIMDGNGRWAQARNRPRLVGHRVGARAVRRTVEAAPRHGIGTLTLYAFSSDNWQRPHAEVRGLMALFSRYLATEQRRCLANGVRVSVIGRRDRLAPELAGAIAAAEHVTRHGTTLHLRLAVDYSARDAIVRAARDAPICSRDEFAARLAAASHAPLPHPDLDLLIRTGGEKRISDFLLWESAYAELIFLDDMWPDFHESHLEAAIHDFRRRSRRFGAVPVQG